MPCCFACRHCQTYLGIYYNQVFCCVLYQGFEHGKTCKISWMAMITFLFAATTALAKYTNRPLNGYVCNDNFYEHRTDISQHQCLHRCLSNDQCATLSYNPVGNFCLLGSERCPSATLHPEFMLMVFRETERHQDCISWIPGNKETTTDRVLTATVGPPFRLARWSDGNNQLPGFSKTIGMMFFPDVNINQFRRIVGGYDVLVVSRSCTLAWVPYTAGKPLPDGAQQTGVLNGVAVYSIMVPDKRKKLQRFGSYVAGDVVGYQTLWGDIRNVTDVYILVLV